MRVQCPIDVVEGLVANHQDGIDVRLLIDARQAMNTGTARALRLFDQVELPYFLVEGQPLVMVTPEARLVADAQKRVRSLPMARAAGLCA